MANLADLIAYRDALQEARLRGIREVRDSDGSAVTYKSDAEMASALAAVGRDITAQTTGPRAGTVRFTTSKGL